MQHILVDLRPLSHARVSGVETYVKNQLHALLQTMPEAQFTLWSNSKKPTPEIFEEFSTYPNVKTCQTTIPNKLLNLTLSLLRWPKIDRWVAKRMGVSGFDTVWIPDPRPSPISKRTRKILTIHDLSPIHFWHTFNQKTRLWHRLLRLKKEITESSAIVTPSQYTALDLTETFDVDPKKITIIPEAAAESMFPETDIKFLAQVREKYHLPEKFFLTLSTIEPRKNLRGLISDFLDWKSKTKHPHKLVIVGKERPEIFSQTSIKTPVEGGRDRPLQFTGFVSEEEKRALFSMAELFVFPSFFEGFGLPLVEAMACGCAVLSSETSSMPEVVGDAGILFNPYDETALPKLFEEVVSNQKLLEEMQKKSLEQSKKFSWEKAAKALKEAFIPPKNS